MCGYELFGDCRAPIWERGFELSNRWPLPMPPSKEDVLAWSIGRRAEEAERPCKARSQNGLMGSEIGFFTRVGVEAKPLAQSIAHEFSTAL
jgi:hypothetical protein